MTSTVRWAGFAVWSLAVFVAAGCDRERPAAPERAAADGPSATLVLGGDAMFGRWRDGDWERYIDAGLLRRFGEIASPADLAAANLETAICPEEMARGVEFPEEHVRLTAPPSALGKFVETGIDVVSVANNHATDCGRPGLERTERWLAGREIEAVGVRKPGEERAPAVEVPLGDVGAAVFVATTVYPPRGATAGSGPGPDVTPVRQFGEFVEHVEAVRAGHSESLVVVSVHWGADRAAEPSVWQTEKAESLLEAGADVVMGHGSHAVQRIDRHEGAGIAYGLGNLHFDMRSGAASERFAVRLTIEGRDDDSPAVIGVETLDLTSETDAER